MNLDTFIKRLERADELIRIPVRVDPRLEISEIADRFSSLPDGGKALLFEDTGTGYPLLINALGSGNRIRIALGDRSPDELAGEMQEFLKILTAGDRGSMDKIRLLPMLGRASRWLPVKRKGRGESQQVVDRSPDLGTLPIITSWPFDGGPFITLPLVHTLDPLNGSRNLGMYRMQVFGSNSTGMHWHMHKTGARHYREYAVRGKRMPVAVALGGDPVYTYCATAPLPDGIDEYLLAGFIRKKPVRLVKCITQDIWVPDDCDFVLEGYVDPSEPLHNEGPFGDHTGFYSLEDQYPVFHLTAVTHRRNAVYPATLVGIPPQEDAWLAWTTERLFKPMIRMALAPELEDFHLPVAGVAHNLGLLKIQTTYPGQGRKVLHSLWGAGQMMFTKFFIVTGDGPPLTHYLDLARYVSARVDPSENHETASGPLDILDHSARTFAFGGKLGLDATGPERFWPQDSSAMPEEQEIMAFRSQNPSISDMNLNWVRQGVSVGLVSLRKTHGSLVRELADEIRLSESLSRVRFWIFFDEWADLNQVAELVWLTGSNVEVNSDVLIYATAPGRHSGILFADATSKSAERDGFTRPWPNPTVMDPDTIAKVDGRWKEYGVGEFIPSRSRRYQKAYQTGAVRKV